jgi:hypothetical protein
MNKLSQNCQKLGYFGSIFMRQKCQKSVNFAMFCALALKELSIKWVNFAMFCALKELSSAKNDAFVLCSKISPMEKKFVLNIGKNDTRLWSILSPWKNWFHWKKNQTGSCTRSKLSVEKNPPDIEKQHRFELSPT